ncbi:cell adhesion molecule 2 [Lingula anatina]|uniref:Cell adhesion molecule 2 n=1 Tax=Lingula anatina TaxID=7574 RepID=A0A1S3JEC4_LINAN|nr:cell adhesion molecule 2 [Lingula anatina]|eukprot:XP_013408239.1 cell adhesion molecule 2 [Lingula anatina]
MKKSHNMARVIVIHCLCLILSGEMGSLHGVYGRPNVSPPQVNVTVTENKDAILPCSVNHLGELIVWKKEGLLQPLTVGNFVFTDDERLSTACELKGQDTKCSLKINRVSVDDAGIYFCEVSTNTDVHLKHQIRLNVEDNIQIGITYQACSLKQSHNMANIIVFICSCLILGGEMGSLHGVQGRMYELPSFNTTHVNVTVIENKDAMLPCSVDLDRGLNVLWQDPEGFILTYNERRVIDSNRFSIPRLTYTDWSLYIDEVKLSDQGSYKCSIGPNPVLMKVVSLHIKVPAKIVSNRSSPILQKVKEGDTVILTCNVTGQPTPKVKWYRREVTESADAKKKAIEIDSEVMIIHNISRHSDGIYECQAHNGVGTSASRLMSVEVEYGFPPRIRLPNLRIGQSVGKDTILECLVTAKPLSIIYWMYKGKETQTSSKYSVVIYNEGRDAIGLSLRIHDLTEEDFGEYTCIAKNHFGSVKGSLTVYENADTRKIEPINPKNESPAVLGAPEINMTVLVNQDTVLPCSVYYLGEPNVYWVGPDENLLTMNDVVFSANKRFSILRPSIRDWNLRIDAVKETDHGTYTCGIRSNPSLKKVVRLYVKGEHI